MTVKIDEQNDVAHPIFVVGSYHVRVNKVISLIEKTVALNPSDDLNHIEFVPCVASFQSYDDADGMVIRYLHSLECCGEKQLREYFDDGRVMGMVIGCGIDTDSDDDVDPIRTFISTLVSANDEDIPPIQSLQPSQSYATVKEELEVYRSLSPDEKQQVEADCTIGPGRMAKFVVDFVSSILNQDSNVDDVNVEISCSDTTHIRVATEEVRSKTKNEVTESNVEEEELTKVHHHEIDMRKDRYSCRMCRCVLFGINDLTNDHVPSKHNFSYRKQRHAYLASSASAPTSCQSLFLNDAVLTTFLNSTTGVACSNGDGTEDDVTATVEGKFNCPNCRIKLGSWKWSGAQCSCGTWVAPAIQIPISKVDLVPPIRCCESVVDRSVPTIVQQSS